jgi:hypothetical protein
MPLVVLETILTLLPIALLSHTMLCSTSGRNRRCIQVGEAASYLRVNLRVLGEPRNDNALT